MTPQVTPPAVTGNARALRGPSGEPAGSPGLSSMGSSPLHTGLFIAQALPGRPSPRTKVARRHACTKPSGAAFGRCQASAQRRVSSTSTQNTAACQPSLSPSVFKTPAAASSSPSASASKPSTACWAARYWRLVCCCLLRSDSVRVNLLLAPRRRSKRSLVSAASWLAFRSRARDSASSFSSRSTSGFLPPTDQAFQSDFRLAESLAWAICYLADNEHAPRDAVAFDGPAPGIEVPQGSVRPGYGEPHFERLSPSGPRWRRRPRRQLPAALIQHRG